MFLACFMLTTHIGVRDVSGHYDRSITPAELLTGDSLRLWTFLMDCAWCGNHIRLRKLPGAGMVLCCILP